jgi:PIN domain nuclease of toxin-antitoxin system
VAGKVILLDTCALIWWTLDPDKLSAKAQRACDSILMRGALVSSVSFWEIGIKIKKKRLEAGISLREYVDRIRSMGTVTIVPVDERIWLASIELDWDHSDPADRVIVSTAKMHKASIVTSDAIIRKYYKKTVW